MHAKNLPAADESEKVADVEASPAVSVAAGRQGYFGSAQ